MTYIRTLRIVISVICGLCSALVAVLWVRSYFYRDVQLFTVRNPRVAHVISRDGRVSCALVDVSFWSTPPENALLQVDHPLLRQLFTEPGKTLAIPAQFRPPLVESLLFDWHRDPDGTQITVPYWFVVLIPIAFAAATWCRWWRFSLRTLLIATTLVAVGLGLIIYVT